MTDLGAQGRFKREVQTRVTSVPSYPSQPANSPFAKGFDEVVGPEPPLNMDLNQVEPVGTPVEVEKCIDKHLALGGSVASPTTNEPPNLDPALSADDGSLSFHSSSGAGSSFSSSQDGAVASSSLPRASQASAKKTEHSASSTKRRPSK